MKDSNQDVLGMMDFRRNNKSKGSFGGSKKTSMHSSIEHSSSRKQSREREDVNAQTLTPPPRVNLDHIFPVEAQ